LHHKDEDLEILAVAFYKFNELISFEFVPSIV